MDVVRFLLANNADVNAVDSNGWTPLHGTALLAFSSAKLAKLLFMAMTLG